jgi:hypothetical protein
VWSNVLSRVKIGFERERGSATASIKYLPTSLTFDSFILPLEDVDAARDVSISVVCT